jgi:hypothetical protein
VAARTGLLAGGLIIALMGTLWAMQGAYLIPATFMRGYEWVGIGAATAALGVLMVLVALRMPPRKREPTAVPPPARGVAAASVE